MGDLLEPYYLKQTKGGHGLHKDSYRLQTMTAFNQKFLQGGPDASRGRFLQKESPLVGDYG
jgi:hypothetical protein